ncbi:hypothetical protein GOBAR_AA17259 [Gossypium barbadense]|uniref:Uncharacterized protein n=1 Tax=Gossypium barbadense TaxID=3634 RepID=A0A2P5XJ61_GOSBA|nr:hypothetical protein GOBAR_AA17259 [Gossypium barbadense]
MLNIKKRVLFALCAAHRSWHIANGPVVCAAQYPAYLEVLPLVYIAQGSGHRTGTFERLTQCAGVCVRHRSMTRDCNRYVRGTTAVHRQDTVLGHPICLNVRVPVQSAGTTLRTTLPRTEPKVKVVIPVCAPMNWYTGGGRLYVRRQIRALPVFTR